MTPANDKAWGNLWRALEQSGDARGLEQALRDGTAAPKVAVDARFRLGSLLLNSNRNADAEREFQLVLAQQPQHMAARINLGLALGRQGQTERAEKELRQAIQDHPQIAGPHYYLALLLSGSGRKDEALAQLQQALAIKPDPPAAAELLKRLSGAPK